MRLMTVVLLILVKDPNHNEQEVFLKEMSGHMILLQLDDLPCGYKVLRPNGDEIYAFLEGREVDLV